jgi:hypothetical protein
MAKQITTAQDDWRKLVCLFERYGEDFLPKCAHYKTAKLGDEYVALKIWHKNELSFTIQFINGDLDKVKVTVLSNFVL